MDCFRITGGVRLLGRVRASGSKNAALPIMAAALLVDGPVTLHGVPDLADVNTLALLLGYLGVEVKREPGGNLRIATVDPAPTKADYDLVRRMRASFCVLGPLLAKRGRGVVSLPGGCNIGTRPVDLHLAGLSALGAEVRIEHGYVIASARRLRGAAIRLQGPFGPTVTGTANVMSAASLALGRTVISGAATEPEIVDLGNFLIAMGAQISGLGTDTIEITGVDELKPTQYKIISDRIEVGTLLLAGAISGGCVTVEDARPEHLAAVLDALSTAGADVDCRADEVTLRAVGRPRPTDISAQPYAGIPTD
ncbi:MAG TPA: UDP-N-acetylglucosamine 1-carboxyvinyltransferase, partial [Pirellulales bacterium]|nr:UDP-N-acetylglucosamine 1-carboxyvinyltransferase [Pirellulales bacterium]